MVVCANGGTHTVQWCPERKPTNMKELILGVRRTRNNLFHGGKSLTGPIEQAERNEKLIRAAHAVLREMLKSDSDLKSCFEQTDI